MKSPPAGIRFLLAAFALMTLASTRLANAGGLLYFVNTTSDSVVAGACANGLANCSLRGAILAANSHPGEDGIEMDLPAGAVINLTQALPDLTDSVGISGLGADKLTVRRNTAGSYRIFNVTTTGTVTFSGMAISNGTSGSGGGSGGGIQNVNSGTVNVSQCVISGNTGNSAGGIFNQTSGIVNVSNSTIADNLTTDGGIFGGGAGGGILNLVGTVNVANCTISGNTGTEGGGIHTKNNGAVNVSNSTLTGNHATFGLAGGGLGHSNTATGSFLVKNCIIAGNTSGDPDTAGQDVSGTFNSAGFNLIGKIDGGTGFNAVTDQKGTNSAPLDAKLDPNGLQNNGGPTPTIRLLLASPAIEKATSIGLTGTLTTDQRGAGFPRRLDYPTIANAAGGDGTDIGACEFGGPLVPISMSRKMHGALPFDIDLPPTGNVGNECRSGGVNNDHQVIMTFPSLVTVTSASITTGSGSVSGSTVSGGQVTVNLTGVANAQTTVLTLFGVNNGTNTTNVSVPMGVLVGDTNGNGGVNASDIAQTKANSGQAVTASNFRTDVNVSGSISAADVGLVKSRAGTGLP